MLLATPPCRCDEGRSSYSGDQPERACEAVRGQLFPSLPARARRDNPSPGLLKNYTACCSSGRGPTDELYLRSSSLIDPEEAVVGISNRLGRGVKTGEKGFPRDIQQLQVPFDAIHVLSGYGQLVVGIDWDTIIPL